MNSMLAYDHWFQVLINSLISLSLRLASPSLRHLVTGVPLADLPHS